MEKKTETTLHDILKLLELQSDKKVRSLFESLLENSRNVNLVKPELVKHIDKDSILKINRDHTLPHLLDLDNLRKLRKQIEEKIEALIEKIHCLLERLKRKRKIHDCVERKKLLKLILDLINLQNLKNLIERLETNIDITKITR